MMVMSDHEERTISAVRLEYLLSIGFSSHKFMPIIVCSG